MEGSHEPHLGPLPVAFLPFAPRFLEENISYVDELQTICQDLTDTYYDEYLSPFIENGHGQLEYDATVERNIACIVSKGFFLRGGVDTNVFIFHIFDVLWLIFV